MGSATVVATSARGGRPLRAFSMPIVSGGGFGANDLPCHDGIGYMISRGLAKSGTRYAGGEDPLNQGNR